MDVAFGDFTLTEREALFEDTSNSIEFVWQDGIDEKVYYSEKSSSRSRKVTKQRAIPVETANAVQFSEKCLRQKGGGVKVDGEIIFQAPLPSANDNAITDVCANESSKDDLLTEVQAHGSPLNEETPSFLNVAAPEFVPESAPPEIKDEEENVIVGSSSDVSSSQSAHPQKQRHFNKHQQYPAYPVLPDYPMLRGHIPPHLPLPYPYYMPRHPREPLIPVGMPFGYPYPPMQLQQSRAFADGRHPQIYTAGMPSEVYMMEFGVPFPQDIQGRLYPWAGVPDQAAQSPEPDQEAHDSPDGTQENLSPTANTGGGAESRSHNNNATSSENDADQFPVANSSDDVSTKLETSDSHFDDTGGDAIGTSKTEFSEESHTIKDNSTGQVVDTGYIHKNMSSSCHNNDDTPSTVVSKVLPEHIDLVKSNLESNSEKAEVTGSSREGLSDELVVQQDRDNSTPLIASDICDPPTQLKDAQNVQTEHAVAEITKPELQPTVTPISVCNDAKVISEEKLPVTSPPVVTKKLPGTALGNKLNEPKLKPTPVAQHHKVDRKTSNNNHFRTSNQFSSTRENSNCHTDSLASTSSGKMSSKGLNKSGPNIILRASNPPEKRTYQQSYHVDPVAMHSTGNKDTHYTSSFSSNSVSSEAKKSHPHSSVPKETSNFSSSANSNSTTAHSGTQVETKKPNSAPAWGQGKNWSQLFNNNSSSKDTTVLPAKESVVQGVPISSGSSEMVTEQAPPNLENVNKQLKSLGEQLKSITVDHKSLRPFLPRGLVNRGNMCYVHTVLQVLLSCPSMYNLFSSLNQFPVLSKEPSATPLTDCMIQFTSEFRISEADFEANQKANRKKKGGRDLAKGSPFQPDYVYSVLHKMRSSLTVRGKQEDAEEFLGSILDGLHEEMIEAKEAVKIPGSNKDSSSTEEVLSPGSSDETNEWEEVGHKNKSTITRVVSSSAESHITEIFGGKMRSAVHSQGAKESATVQPFFTLPLDIQANDVTNVEEALSRLAVKETLLGYTCSKTQTEVEAFKRVTLSKLPSVLTLHLKRFLFNQTGGSQKLSKEISYPLELEIPKELMAPTLVKGTTKTYKLTGVIYHHGKDAAGGHYTCDVYHSSCAGWIRLDDSLIKPVNDDQVTKHYKERTAYLLFYQKSDIPYNR